MSETKHFFVKGIGLERNSQGKWRVTVLKTNFGKFGIGEKENENLDEPLIDQMSSYIVSQLKGDIVEYLQQEEAEAKKAKEAEQAETEQSQESVEEQNPPEE